MNSGCSESCQTSSWSSDCSASTSCHHRSRPSVISTGCSLRRTTSTCWTDWAWPSPAWPDSAVSTAGLSGEGLPRRQEPSAVTTNLAWASSMRERRSSAEKPPKTTECTAPIRAQASMAITDSTIIGM